MISGWIRSGTEISSKPWKQKYSNLRVSYDMQKLSQSLDNQSVRQYYIFELFYYPMKRYVFKCLAIQFHEECYNCISVLS